MEPQSDGIINLYELDDDSLAKACGGNIVVERYENGNIKIANYYCDNCGALVMTQQNGKFEKKMPFYMRRSSDWGDTLLCDTCYKNKT